MKRILMVFSHVQFRWNCSSQNATILHDGLCVKYNLSAVVHDVQFEIEKVHTLLSSQYFILQRQRFDHQDLPQMKCGSRQTFFKCGWQSDNHYHLLNKEQGQLIQTPEGEAPRYLSTQETTFKKYTIYENYISQKSPNLTTWHGLKL